MRSDSIEADVVVVGGGAAGIAAAVGASKSGARVCLVERYGFLGGAATASSVLTHCGFFDQQGNQVVAGVGQEMLDRLAAQDLYRTHTVAHTGNKVVLLDLETMKRTYDQMVIDAGIDTLLHTHMTHAETTDNTTDNTADDAAGNAIEAINVVHRGGNIRITGSSFVDASGDGTLISSAGAGELLAEPDQRQAATLVMRVAGMSDDAGNVTQDDLRQAIGAYTEATGVELPRDHGIVVRMPVVGDRMMLLADQYFDVLDPRALVRAEMAARNDAWHYVRALREYLPGWQDAYLLSTGPQIGIRETRRLAGREIVAADDVGTGQRRPEDGIGRGGWPMENHLVKGRTDYTRIADGGSFDIPLGAVTSSTTSNLWAAGRLTSSDSLAFGSLRVMGTSFATGHAAGVAAALAASTTHNPHTDAGFPSQVRTVLAEHGALI